jgi:hypothetical protein
MPFGFYGRPERPPQAKSLPHSVPLADKKALSICN